MSVNKETGSYIFDSIQLQTSIGAKIPPLQRSSNESFGCSVRDGTPNFFLEGDLEQHSELTCVKALESILSLLFGIKIRGFLA
jgi:hypothetical protein